MDARAEQRLLESGLCIRQVDAVIVRTEAAASLAQVKEVEAHSRFLIWTRANAHEPEKFPPGPGRCGKWWGQAEPRCPPQALVRSGAAFRALGAGFLRWR